nr:zinc finger protein 729-like [Biomphalaria glabrata]
MMDDITQDFTNDLTTIIKIEKNEWSPQSKTIDNLIDQTFDILLEEETQGQKQDSTDTIKIETNEKSVHSETPENNSIIDQTSELFFPVETQIKKINQKQEMTFTKDCMHARNNSNKNVYYRNYEDQGQNYFNENKTKEGVYAEKQLLGD